MFNMIFKGANSQEMICLPVSTANFLMTWTTSRQKPFVVPGPTSQIFQALDEFLKVDPGNPAARALLLEIETEEMKRKAKRVGPGFAEAGRPGMARLGWGGGGSVGDRLGMGVGCFWLFLAWKEMECLEWNGQGGGMVGKGTQVVSHILWSAEQ
jgi:hypothetical protein